MKFIRLDEKTIRFVLSKEDLEDHGVAMSDFIENNQSAKDLIDFLLKKSIHELDYVKEGKMITINVTPLPEDSIALTFYDSSDELIEMVRHAVEIFKNYYFNKGFTDQNEKLIKDAMIDEEFQKISHKLSGRKSSQNYDYFAFRFSSLENVIKYAKALGIDDNRMVASTSLYRSHDKWDGYYLTMNKGAMDQAKFNYMGLSCLEFGRLESSDVSIQAFIDEHYRLIIDDNAIEALRRI